MRILFFCVALLVLLLICVIIDQAFVRLMRLMMSHHAANVVRFTVMAVVVLTVTVSVVVGHCFTRLRLEVREATVVSPRLPQAFDGMRVAQISDFHLDSFTPDEGARLAQDLVEQMKRLQPDVLCFTGDLVTLRAAEAYPFREALRSIAQAGVPVYSILGNHDYADYKWDYTDEQRRRDVDTLVMLQEQAGWHMLRDAGVTLRRDSAELRLVGVENIGEPPFTVYGNLERAMGGWAAADTTFTVLLTHNPIHWRSEVLPRTHIDLTLSGHTHAMQMRFFGWSPAAWRYAEWGGLYSEDDQHLYVNTGLGCVGPRVRIGVRPELTVITLRCR